ncbi:hypothetical protein BGW36DRAFT_386349 [Talaromyces proteolyticus]|uniref:Uncharacterized protein n=1 Tax=Talaromyces proteolyticus TaxID=1131652 RepID=A0AAD4PU40_9EURO|nr:uncharacterized protein BGW36DRAFT_386349 [Talaromyces proteolyticus]KAH8691810.1 hypothetical protein BGW36DRAFT_386349 [Talaromyces proteolyticus]
MALEISPVRVQMTKMRGLPGDPEQFHEIYQELLLSTLSISSQIISQSQTCMLQRMWMPEDEPMSKDFMRVAAEEFNEAFRHSYEKEAKAKQIWIDKWRRKKESDFLMPWL